MQTRIVVALVVALALLLMPGCAGVRPGAAPKSVVRFGIQYGLAHAPFVVAKARNTIQKYMPGVEVQITYFAGGGAVREALLAGSVDVASLAMPPVLQAWDKGADVKMALAISDAPMAMMTYRPDIKSIRDIRPNDKIAVPSLGSPQDLLVKMAAQKLLGNANALDNHLVVMAHPDAMAALLAKRDIVAHVATPPFIQAEQKAGMHQVLDSRDFSQFTLVVAATTRKFTEGEAKLYAATVKGLTDAEEWIQKNPREAAQLLASQPGEKQDADALQAQLAAGVTFYAVPHGAVELAELMKGLHMLSKVPTFDDVTWKNLHGKGGS